MRGFLLTTLSILSLTGCMATELSTQGKSYDPVNDARIRLYGQNGKQSTLEVDINGKKEKITVGGGLGQALSSMAGMKENESIGMPATAFSKDPSAHSKAFSGIFFKEFVIPAGKTVTVNNGISDLVNQSINYNNVTGYKDITTVTLKGCSGDNVSFIPQAGKDYEVVPINSGASCGVIVHEIK